MNRVSARAVRRSAAGAAPAQARHAGRRVGALLLLAAAAALAVLLERVRVPGGDSPAATVWWTALVMAIVTFAWRAAGALWPEPLVERLLVAGLLFNVGAATVVTLPGFLGRLSPGTVTGLTLMLLAIAVWLPAGTGEQGRATTPGAPRSSIQAVPWLLLGAAWAVTVLNQVRYTVQDSDNMWYHLPMVAEWIRTGSLWPSDTIPLIARAYPGFREAVLTFLSLPLRSESLALPGILELPMLAAAVACLCARLGAPPLLASASAAYAATMPVVAQGTHGNDLALTVYFAIGLLFALGGSWTRPAALLAGLALGALASTKFSGAFYAVLVVGFAGSTLAASPGSRQAKLAHLGVLVGTASLIAGPWYLRNMLAFGNPFYPAEIRVAGFSLLPGPLPPEYFAPTRLGWSLEPLIAGDTVKALGPLVPLFALGPVIALTVGIYRRSLVLVAAGCGALGCLVLFLQQPFSADLYGAALRYLLPWVVLSLVATVVLAGQVRVAAPVVVAALLMGAVGNLSLWTRWWWLLTGVAVAVVAAGRVVTANATVRLSVPRWLLAGGAALALAGTATLVSQVREQLRHHPHYGYRDASGDRGWGAVVAWVHRHIAGARVVVTGRHDFYPLYGKGFSNTLFRLEGTPSPAELLAFCRAVNAEYVVAFVPVRQRLSRFDFRFGTAVAPAALREYPRDFSIVVEHDGAYVLRVHPAGRAAA